MKKTPKASKAKIPASAAGTPSSAGKKLIQARLPFAPLGTSPKTTTTVTPAENRKRKLSKSSDEDLPVAKVNRLSNIKDPVINATEVINLNDEDSNENKDSLVQADKKDSKQNKKDGEECKKNESLTQDIDEKTPDAIGHKRHKSKSGKKDKSASKSKKLIWGDEEPEADQSDEVKISIKLPVSRKRKLSEKKELKKSSSSDENVLNTSRNEEKKGSEEHIGKGEDKESEANNISSESVYRSLNFDNLDEKKETENESENVAADSDTKKKEESLPAEADDPKLISSREQSDNKTKIPKNFKKDLKAEETPDKTLDDKNDNHSNTDDDGDKESDKDSKITADQKDQNSDVEVLPDSPENEIDPENDKTENSKERENKSENDASGVLTPKHVVVLNSDQKLTPKQVQKKLEAEKRQQEKQKAKEERDKKLQEEKEQKQKEREEKERLRKKEKEEKEQQKQKEKDEKEQQKQKEKDEKEQQKQKEKDEKEEQRRKEKEERDKKKQAEIDAKNEERKRKEEQKEEERKKKEEERLAAEEAKNKKSRKEAEAFSKFFLSRKSVTKKSENKDTEIMEPDFKTNFMPFQIKEDMKLAPIVRRLLSDERKCALEMVINSKQTNEIEDLYLMNLRTGVRVPEKDKRTLPNEDDDVKIIDDDLEGAAIPIEEEKNKQTYRAKYLKFHENQRPAYFGTWRKISRNIKPRRPFATDKIFDYEVDSDDEWEEEEPGESLHGSDDEKESDDDYDIDNEFFVPHGHLSDEELEQDGDGDDEDNSPQAQKEKLKIIQKQFVEEMKKKTEKIKPRLVGLIWQNKNGGQPSGCPNVVWDMLMTHAMLLDGKTISMVRPTVPDPDDVESGGEDGAERKVPKRQKVTEEAVTDLIRLIHGNVNNKKFLAREFRTYWEKQNEGKPNLINFSEISIRQKIKQLAVYRYCPDEGPMLNKMCWYVSADQFEAYGVKEPPQIPNAWEYILKPPRNAEVKEKSPPIVVDQSDGGIKTAKIPANGGIAKFTTVLSDEDKKKNFAAATKSSVATQGAPVIVGTPPVAAATAKEPKKRVQLLMSVPRGQEIPTKTKNALISQFLGSDKSKMKEVIREKRVSDDGVALGQSDKMEVDTKIVNVDNKQKDVIILD